MDGYGNALGVTEKEGGTAILPSLQGFQPLTIARPA
jgi:hypothetical protein